MKPDLDRKIVQAGLKSGDDVVTARERAAIGRLVGVKLRAASSPARIFRPEPRDEEAEKTLRLEILVLIRVQIHAETRGTCVACGLPVPFPLMHAHHILSGPERQLEERAETMAPLHERCHDWVHGKDPKRDQRDALEVLLAWCIDTRRELAAASTRHRIAKIDEARAVEARS